MPLVTSLLCDYSNIRLPRNYETDKEDIDRLQKSVPKKYQEIYTNIQNGQLPFKVKTIYKDIIIQRFSEIAAHVIQLVDRNMITWDTGLEML